MNVETKPVGYAIYDCPKHLKAFILARESGAATKEMLQQLADAAEAERLEDLAKKNPKATILDFNRAQAERDGKAQC
jgi:hypothetical protein